MCEESKSTAVSRTTMTEIVLQTHVNGTGRLFGGQLMSWMDIAGAICAKRHASFEVVTVAADRLEFYSPALPNDVVIIDAQITAVGNTSMQVAINAEVEQHGKGKLRMQRTCSAIFTYVAIDPQGQKRRVPRIAD